MIPELNIVRASNEAELSRLLAETGGQVLAGGTDLLPRLRRGLTHHPALVDATPIAGLRAIAETADGITIGALATHADLAASPLLQERAPALVQAALTVGCPQTRNRGTLGGNLANASPAADTLPPLLAYAATVRLRSLADERRLPLAQFLLGPGRTALRPGEWIAAVHLPAPDSAFHWGSAFLKLGRRSGMAIAVVSAAVVLSLDSRGRIAEARVALGSVAPTARRSPAVEAGLAGQVPTADLLAHTAARVGEDIQPIDDLRASAVYRAQSARVLVRRACAAAVAAAGCEVPA